MGLNRQKLELLKSQKNLLEAEIEEMEEVVFLEEWELITHDELKERLVKYNVTEKTLGYPAHVSNGVNFTPSYTRLNENGDVIIDGYLTNTNYSKKDKLYFKYNGDR
jgi:hypothetical protein